MPGSWSSAMLFRILYWLAVLLVSLILVVGLILVFESRDQSSVEGAFQSIQVALVP